MRCLDYGRSFICTNGPYNAPQLLIESRCRLIDERANLDEEYIQCAACKSEDTFADRELFRDPNYDFLPVFGSEYTAIFRRYAEVNDRYLSYVRSGELWGGQRKVFRDAPNVAELNEGEQVVRATLSGLPMIGRTELRNDDTGLRAIIEFPVKSMNANEERMIWQVDTGPVLFPDVTQGYTRDIERFRLAFVAFNTTSFADFVIEQPTVISGKGDEVAQVYHYSRIISMASKNTLFAAEGI